MPVDGPQYPVNLVLEGRPCLVVGGGVVAARKAAGLRACGACVHVVAPAVSEAVRADERTALKAAGRSTEDADWKKALDSDMLELIRAGQIMSARERLQACLSSS